MYRIKRYQPVNLLNEVNKMFEESFQPWPEADASSTDTSQWIPAVDIKEEKSRFVILADLPGIDKKDVNISMENNVLSIQGERVAEAKEEKNSFSRIERIRGSFYRRFVLPDTADGEKIQATMKKGVLEINIPKKERKQSRFIEITNEE